MGKGSHDTSALPLTASDTPEDVVLGHEPGVADVAAFDLGPVRLQLAGRRAPCWIPTLQFLDAQRPGVLTLRVC